MRLTSAHSILSIPREPEPPPVYIDATPSALAAAQADTRSRGNRGKARDAFLFRLPEIIEKQKGAPN